MMSRHDEPADYVLAAGETHTVRYFRPAEVGLLIGDSSKARKQPGWRHEIGFEALIAERIAADRIAVGQEVHGHGG